MIYFDCDYMDAAHPLIMEKMLQCNGEKNQTYGTDDYCKQASEKIRKACGTPDAEVHFMVGGTQTNATVIDALLRPYEGVVAADTAHINVHEAGAIETSGHKVLTIPHRNGKIDCNDLEIYLKNFQDDLNKEHTVYPGMVYVSHPTEYGTLYTQAELRQLSAICQAHHLPLYLDGARLPYALVAEESDVTLRDVAAFCDVFYIGGTKNGAMFGEAVVFKNKLIPHFFTYKKLHGALLAKGWLLGMQFDVLFTDDLYLANARHALKMADLIRNMFRNHGYRFYIESPTNQVFVVMKNETIDCLQAEFSFSVWEKYDESHKIVRFATTWSTLPEEVERLDAALSRNQF